MKTIQFIIFFSLNVFGQTCENWFLEKKINPGSNCVSSCSITATELDTYMCTQQCEKLCNNKSVIEKILSQMAYYPGLNLEEKKLISKYPKEAFLVFLQKEKAEKTTARLFNRDNNNDESDAFRHFLWAALLYKELGKDIAKQFLEAHEKDPKENKIETEMDKKNNQIGLQQAEKLQSKGKLNAEELEKIGLDLLKKEKLKIITRLGMPK